MVIRLVMKVRTSSKDDVARELRTRLKRSLDAMGVKLPSLVERRPHRLRGRHPREGREAAEDGPSAVVTDAAGASATKVKSLSAPKSPTPPTTGGTE